MVLRLLLLETTNNITDGEPCTYSNPIPGRPLLVNRGMRSMQEAVHQTHSIGTSIDYSVSLLWLRHPDNKLRPSGNSELVEDPLDTSVVVAAIVIEEQKELVSKNSCQQLSAVVIDSVVPDAFVQFKV